MLMLRGCAVCFCWLQYLQCLMTTISGWQHASMGLYLVAVLPEAPRCQHKVRKVAERLACQVHAEWRVQRPAMTHHGISA